MLHEKDIYERNFFSVYFKLQSSKYFPLEEMSLALRMRKKFFYFCDPRHIKYLKILGQTFKKTNDFSNTDDRLKKLFPSSERVCTYLSNKNLQFIKPKYIPKKF